MAGERNGVAGTTYGVPARPDTLAERVEFLSGGMRPVQCAHCGTKVLVKKNSPKHTSIQWTSDSGRCPVLAGQQTSGGTALPDTCTHLAESIWEAARAGQLEVPDAG